jgi:hypothetical protein
MPIEKSKANRMNRRRIHMSVERRQYPRHPVICRVDYADRQRRAWWGLIRDLSQEGVFIEYTPALTVGERVMTTFTLPEGPPFKLKAQVVRVSATGAGLKFIGLSAHATDPYPDSLEEYCAALYKAWLAHREATSVVLGRT